MARTIGIAMALLVASHGAAPAAAEEGDPALPGWMAGCWEQRDGDRWVEECWMKPRGDIMLGNSRTGVGDRVTEWETMQIVLDQEAGDGPVARMAFWAAPEGQKRTLFAWNPDSTPGVTFSNVAHDYPQRIRYWREGDVLNAEISKADGTNPMRWRYVRVKQP